MKVLKTLLLAVTAISFSAGSPLAAQDREAAKEEGKAFAGEQQKRARTNASTQPDASRIPGYTSNPAEAGYADNPERIEGDARAVARSHEGMKAIKDSNARRAKFETDEIKAVTAIPAEWKLAGRRGAAFRSHPLPDRPVAIQQLAIAG